jgi:hypothetical protein
MDVTYFSAPSPHAVIPQLVEPELYRRIKFPDLPERPLGRIGRDLYCGEPGWAELMRTPGWAKFSATFMSESFMKQIVRIFADDIRRQGCGIDPDAVHLVPYHESRQETRNRALSDSFDPNALFIRFDLQAAGAVYSKTVHCDHPRVIGGVLFMTSAADEGLEGGEFALYTDLEFRNDRTCHRPQVVKKFPVQHNQGVLFLNSNTGFHGPLPLRRVAGLRKWIYYSISSRCDVWKAAS